MTYEEKVALVKSLIRAHGNKFIQIEFIKKDGSLRPLMAHRSKVLEDSVKGTAPSATAARRETLRKQDMLCVEEIVKPGCAEHQWRTVNCATVKKIVADGQTYVFE